jgi:RHS repeat-associated protein
MRMGESTYLGSTSGQFSVDANGGATYMIPVAVPPGTGGMEPKLALSYNSAAPNGMLGVGWSLQGLSAITRVPRTMAQDGVRGAVMYDDDDRFALDGQRLDVVNGEAYGSADAVFHTEIETWVKVVPTYSDTVPGRFGPDSWTVFTRDGKQLQFGATTDSQVAASGSNPSLRVWALNRVTDLHGNYMTISYLADLANGTNYPSEILYTANEAGGLSAGRSVTFSYESRTDALTRFQGGAPISIAKRLVQIQTSVGGAAVRSYNLNYGYGETTNRSQLLSVTECDGSGNGLPATTFASQDGNSGIFEQNAALQQLDVPWQGVLMPVDFDGNGLIDIVNVFSSNGNLQITLLQSDGQGSFTSTSLPVTQISYFTGMQILPLDINGNGAIDLVCATENNGNLGLTALVASQSDSGGWEYTQGPLNGAGPGDLPWGGTLTAADVNGDGLVDLVYTYQNGTTLAIATLFSNGSTFAPSSTDQTSPTISFAAGAQVLAFDFNGDGMTDLLYSTQNGDTLDLTLFLSQGLDGFVQQGNPLPSGSSLSSGGTLLAIDLNADGLGDLLQVSVQGSELVCQQVFSNATSFQLGPSASLQVPNLGNALPLIMAADVNGDGLPEFVVATDNGSALQLSVLILVNGTLTLQAGVTQPSSSVSWGCAVLPMDFNGDGKTDLVYGMAAATGNPPAFTLSSTATAGPMPDLVTSVTNGLGGQYSASYLPLTNTGVYSTTGSSLPGVQPSSLMNSSISGASFQIGSGTNPAAPGTTPSTRLVEFPKYVLASYSKGDNRGNVYSYTYFYNAALMDLTGRGWMGFASVAVSDAQVGTTTTSNYNQTFPLQGTLASASIASATGLMHRTKVTQTSTENAPNTGPSIQLVQTTTIEIDYFTFASGNDPTPDTTELKQMAYDAFGNTIVTRHSGSAWGAPLWQRRTYANDIDKWVLGFATEETMTADAEGQVILSQQQTSYDSLMNPVTTTLWVDANSSQQTQFTFDVFGNVLTVTDPSGAVVTSTYDNQYQAFLSSRTSPENSNGTSLVTRFTESPAFGVVTAQVDANGVQTTQEYDGLGRLLSQSGPDPSGNLVVLSTEAWGSDATGTYLEQTRTTDWNGATTWTKNYLDGLSRVWTSVSLGPDGATPVSVNSSYDSSNRLIARTLPAYQGASAGPSSTVTYDAYGRMVQRVDPAGDSYLTTTWTYITGNQVTMQERGGTVQRTTQLTYTTYNSSRVKISQTDNNGDLTQFSYDALGRLISMQDPLGVVNAVTYDGLSRRTGVSVTSGGTIKMLDTFAYNDSGRTLAHTDTAGTVVQQTYDALRRLVTRSVQPASGSSVTTTYTLDSPDTKYGNGRIASVTTQGGETYTYSYDAIGNQTWVEVAYSGESFTFERNYEPGGKLATLTYPDGSVQTNVFNAAQEVVEVTLSAPSGDIQTLASYDAFTSLGQSAKETRGNGCVTTYDFDATGRVLGRVTTGPAEQTLLNQNYTWNGYNELLAVQDEVSSSGSQTFSYDPVGRLNLAKNAVTSTAVQYDAGGNITSLGETAFSSDWYQVQGGTASGSTVFSATYDTNGNMTAAVRNGVTTDYSYDSSNQLVSSGSATMSYDYTGRRLLKQSSGLKTYSPAPYYEVVEDANGNRQHTIFVFGGEGVLAQSTTIETGTPISGAGLPTPGLFFSHQNNVFSTEMLTDSDGAVSERLAYSPFGVPSVVAGEDTAAHKFTAKTWDEELSLFYFGARYYDPSIGRYLTADDRLGASPARHDAMHRYAYALNDPINQYDPFGHSILGDIGSVFSHDVSNFFTHDVKHFFTSSVPAFFNNQLAATVISYVVDGVLIVGGIAIMATTPFGGPASSVLGATLLGAGISGLVYNVTQSATKKKFSWGEWGIQLGIGAATGLISGGIAVGAGAAVDALAAGGRVAFAAGSLGRIAVNVTAGIVGNAGAGAFGAFLNNLDPLQGHHSLSDGVGAAALFGGIAGGLSAGLSEGLAAKLSRVPNWSVTYADLEEIYTNTGILDRLEPKSTYYMRVLDSTIKNNTLLAVPGWIMSGIDSSVWAKGWHPNW